jgi:uncharacterized protein YdhG (YjbR/CyaY superfamily)
MQDATYTESAMCGETKIPASVDEYIAAFPPDVRVRLEAMRAAITRAAPGASEGISYRMPAYSLNGPLVYFAAHTAHIGLYALPKATEFFKDRLAAYPTSKGTIQFPFDRELPIGLIEEIVRFRVAENAAKVRNTAKAKDRG